jgi:transposase-like protein
MRTGIGLASFAPGSSVSEVARYYDVNATQVFNWRKLYGDDPRAPAVLSSAPRPSYVTRWRRTGWLGRQESNYRISNDAERLLNSLRRPTDGPNPPFR